MNYKLLVFVFSQVVCLTLLAQVSSNSPYTNYGIGETSGNLNTSSVSMGGANTAVVDSNLLFTSNPASYALISEGKPILDISGRGILSRFETTTGEHNTSLFGLNNVAIAFPIKKNWGLTIGMSPYSSVGYKIQERFTFDSKEIRASYVGEGALNKVFLGLGYRPWRDSSNQLSIGFNFGYTFGSISRSRSHEFVDVTTHFNTKAQESLKISDIYFDAGLIYQRRLAKNSFLSIGTSYVLGKSMNTERENYVYSFSGEIGNENHLDTISYSLQSGGSILIPHKFNFGLSYDLFGNRHYEGDKLDFLLKVAVDYSMQDWSKFQLNFNDVNTADTLKASSRLSFGIEFTPSLNLLNKPKINYLKTMKYRIGAFHGQLPYYVNGQQLQEFGMSFGLGFPVPIKFTNASVNLGMELGQRGTTENNLVRERYMGIYFGLSLSPSVKWFQKRKYD